MYSYTCNNTAKEDQPHHIDSSQFHLLIQKFGSPGPSIN